MSNSVIPPTPNADEYQTRRPGSEIEQTSDMFDQKDPIAFFSEWMAQATAQEINDANAMSVATVDSSGLPDVRILLLKGVDARGFVFYSNEESAKGQQLKTSQKAALCFHWKSLKRCVRVRGKTVPVSASESDAYFSERARGSQIGAWASKQSAPLDSRDVFEARIAQVEAQFEGQEIPRPKNWYGWRVIPESIEFWQDRSFRLHDRVVFTRDGADQPWYQQRLFP